MIVAGVTVFMFCGKCTVGGSGIFSMFLLTRSMALSILSHRRTDISGRGRSKHTIPSDSDRLLTRFVNNLFRNDGSSLIT